MVTVDISPDEVAGRVLSPENLQVAVRALRTEGFVVLANVVDTDHLDTLQARMLEDIEALKQRNDAPFNWNVGNIQQDPPPFPPYLFRDILLNDQVVCVTRAMLGYGVKNSFYSGNTALPSEHRQPVHADTNHLWPNMEVAHPACTLVVNVPIVDMTPLNGSTEIWPGTHLDTTVSRQEEIELPTHVVEARRHVCPPIQPSMKRGSVLIRDMRLWHAGMPNRTEAPRPMIAMIHNAGWLEVGTPLVFPKGTESFFADSDLKTCARFVEGPIDHIRQPHGYKYDNPPAS